MLQDDSAEPSIGIQKHGDKPHYHKYKEPEVFNCELSMQYYLSKFEEIGDWNGWSGKQVKEMPRVHRNCASAYQRRWRKP